MPTDTLGAALEREHQEIDAGIEAFAAGLPQGEVRVEPLLEAADALRRHIYLEEVMLFPSLREAGMMAPVFVMLREHGEIWRDLDALEAAAKQGAGNDAMRGTCEQLAARLETHNLKEEAILYPQADRVMTGPASDELRAFLDSGRMPEGWVCERARA